jgi:hypothetical protein
MSNLTTKLKDFRKKKVQKQQKSGEFEQLADDITFFQNIDGEWEKADEPMELVQVTGVLTDEEEIQKIEEKLGMDLETQLFGEVKRGNIIWLTALLKRSGSSQSFNTPSTTGVVKCRVVDIYYGLNKLKEIVKDSLTKKKK